MKKAELKITKKIDSPLAKYNSTGQLFCVLCNQPVKNEMVWTAHINGRGHRDNIQQLKAKKRPQAGSNADSSAPPSKKVAIEPGPSQRQNDNPTSSNADSHFKTPLPATSVFKTPAAISSSSMSKNSVHSIQNQSLKSVPEVQDDEAGQSRMEVEVQEPTSTTPTSNGTSSLPEGFFDDPKLDAKARGLEYRDPEEIEWDNFVKEIATEEVKSSTMRVVDEEESTITRELDEIEEQMTHWQRVLNLEKKAKEVKGVKSHGVKTVTEDTEVDEDDEYDEELDWRSKRH